MQRSLKTYLLDKFNLPPNGLIYISPSIYLYESKEFVRFGQFSITHD